MKFMIYLLFLGLSPTMTYAQPTLRTYLYVWAWDGVDLFEKPDINSLKKRHLKYGDSVFVNTQSNLDNEAEIEIFEGTEEYGKEFPAWKVKSRWVSVGVSLSELGFIPEIYLSAFKPFKFNPQTKLATEKINDYFLRTKEKLEVKKINKQSPLREEVTRYVFKTGIIYEMPYSINQTHYFTLLMPDIDLVKAFFFINAVYNLELEKRGGKSDNIRLIALEDNSLLFSNAYMYSGVEGKKRKMYAFQKVHDFVVITIEEFEVN